jgi:hypothetical protein
MAEGYDGKFLYEIIILLHVITATSHPQSHPPSTLGDDRHPKVRPAGPARLAGIFL